MLDADGEQRTIVMGSYGIGIGRNMAAIAETHHDDKGLVWPRLDRSLRGGRHGDEDRRRGHDDCRRAALRRALAAGVDVIIDDRDARAGVKFADSELVGIPFRVTVGPRGVKDDKVEFTVRSTMETIEVSVAEAARTVADHLSLD